MKLRKEWWCIVLGKWLSPGEGYRICRSIGSVIAVACLSYLWESWVRS